MSLKDSMKMENLMIEDNETIAWNIETDDRVEGCLHCDVYFEHIEGHTLNENIRDDGIMLNEEIICLGYELNEEEICFRHKAELYHEYKKLHPEYKFGHCTGECLKAGFCLYE